MGKLCLIIAISFAFAVTSIAKSMKASDKADNDIARLTAHNLAQDGNIEENKDHFTFPWFNGDNEENKDFLPYFLFNTLKTAMKQSGDNEKENEDFYTFPGFGDSPNKQSEIDDDQA